MESRTTDNAFMIACIYYSGFPARRRHRQQPQLEKGGHEAEEEFTKPFSVVFRPPHTPHPQCVKWIQISNNLQSRVIIAPAATCHHSWPTACNTQSVSYLRCFGNKSSKQALQQAPHFSPTTPTGSTVVIDKAKVPPSHGGISNTT